MSYDTTRPFWCAVTIYALSSIGLGAPSAPSAAAARGNLLELGGWLDGWASSCGIEADSASGSPNACDVYVLVRDSIDVRDHLPAAIEDEDGASFLERELLERLDEGLQRRLLRLQRGAEGRATFEVLLTGIDSRTTLAALDVEGDGTPEPILVRQGQVEVVRFDHRGRARAEPWLTVPGAPAAGFLSSLEPHARTLAWASIGEVRFFDLDTTAGRPQEVRRLALPKTARVGPATVRIESPPVHRVRSVVGVDGTRDPSGNAFVVGPLVESPLRWRTLLVDLDEVTPTEATAPKPEEDGGHGALPGYRVSWLRTPEPERPLDSQVIRFGDQTLLLAQTLRSDRMGMVERRKVRVWRLGADRTRVGAAPVFEHLSVSRMWQDLGIVPSDSDGDGALEITLLQREGFSGKKLQIDRFEASSGATRFAARGRTMSKIPFADWQPVRDLTGDGTSDLLLQATGLHLVAGRPEASKRSRPYETTASWFHALPRAREADVAVTISLADETGEISAEEAEEEFSGADQDGGDDEEPSISWGTPALLGEAGAHNEIVVFGRVGRSRRGGSHVLYLLELP